TCTSTRTVCCVSTEFVLYSSHSCICRHTTCYTITQSLCVCWLCCHCRYCRCCCIQYNRICRFCTRVPQTITELHINRLCSISCGQCMRYTCTTCRPVGRVTCISICYLYSSYSCICRTCCR